MRVLRGGTLIDGTGAGPVTGTTVVVRDQRIEAVTARAGGDWPVDAEVNFSSRPRRRTPRARPAASHFRPMRRSAT